MKLFPWIRPVEIIEWRDRLGIRAEAPQPLSEGVQTLRNEQGQAGEFDDANAEDADNGCGAFMWSFSLKK